MSRHTPGPWFIGREQHDDAPYWFVTAEGRTIEICGLGDEDAASLEDCANARLIAAAPRLLAALQTCETWMAWIAPLVPFAMNPTAFEHARNEARAAIAQVYEESDE